MSNENASLAKIHVIYSLTHVDVVSERYSSGYIDLSWFSLKYFTKIKTWFCNDMICGRGALPLHDPCTHFTNTAPDLVKFQAVMIYVLLGQNFGLTLTPCPKTTAINGQEIFESKIAWRVLNYLFVVQLFFSSLRLPELNM